MAFKPFKFSKEIVIITEHSYLWSVLQHHSQQLNHGSDGYCLDSQ